MLYYNRKGEAISMDVWASLCHPDYKRVADTTVPSGVWVSTVWLGIDHQWGDGPPLIFETMVFPSRDKFRDINMARYSTEEEALKGHEEMVAWAIEWTSDDSS